MTMEAIFAEFEKVIVGITPDYRPSMPFRVGPYDGRLESLDVDALDPALATRLFQVEEYDGLDGSVMNARLAQFKHFVRVEIQYVQDIARGGSRKLRNMRATDKDRLVQVLRPHAWSLSTTAKSVQFVGSSRPSKSTTQHFLYIVFAVDYRLGPQSP